MRTDPKQSLAALEQRCAKARIPVTAQRRTLLEILVSRDDHPTAEQLYGAVAERLPDVSRATVYRSLETLGELGLLRRIEHSGTAVRFDANLVPHHHFLCTRCGAIEDLPLEAVRGSDRLAFAPNDQRIAEEIAVSVRGRCAACAQ